MGAVARQAVRELFCQCGGSLILHIRMEEDMTAQLVYKIESDNQDAASCFSIDFDDLSEVKYTPYFECEKCKQKAYAANLELEFDDSEEVLIFPSYDADEKLGYSFPETRTCEHQFPFAPDVATPKVEAEPEKLPTIKRASAGESIDPAVQGQEAHTPYPAEDWYGMD